MDGREPSRGCPNTSNMEASIEPTRPVASRFVFLAQLGHQTLTQDLADRSLWDTRQRMFYEMRHHGLRRKSKPWPTASDAHFPLSDSIIEKLKPHYFQQLFATDLIASFIPSNPQVAELTSAAAHIRVRHAHTLVCLLSLHTEKARCLWRLRLLRSFFPSTEPVWSVSI